jgi:hypothetical protein
MNTADLLAASPFAGGGPASSAVAIPAAASQQQAAVGNQHAWPPPLPNQPASPLPFLPNGHVLCGQATLPGSRYGRLNQDYVLSSELHDPKQLRQLRWPQCTMACVLVSLLIPARLAVFRGCYAR